MAIPQDRIESADADLDMPDCVTAIHYTHDEPLEYSAGASSDTIWIINGKHLPVIDWLSAENAWRSSEANVLAFSGASATAKGRYRESVLVDSTGEVVRFNRHYDDSASYSDLWSDEASMVAVSGADSQYVISHLLEWGWGLDSVGALTRRFNVRWAQDNCIPAAMGSAVPASTVGELLADAASYCESTTITDQESDAHKCVRSPARSKSCSNHAQTGHPHGAYTQGSAEESDPVIAQRLNPVGKRIFDFTASLFGLIVLSPFLLLIAALVKCTSRGPVFFGHRRQGLGGREFRCWKFRSMRADAEKLQAELLSQNEVDGPQFKIEHDPRLTWIGNFLRQSNLDELPQLYNVLVTLQPRATHQAGSGGSWSVIR